MAMADPLDLLKAAARALPDDLESDATPNLIGSAATLTSWRWVVAVLARPGARIEPLEAVGAEAVALMKLGLTVQLGQLQALGAQALWGFAGWTLALHRILAELTRRVPAGPPRALAALNQAHPYPAPADDALPASDYRVLSSDLRIDRLPDFTSNDPGDLRSIGIAAAVREAAAIRQRGAEAFDHWLAGTRIVVPPPRIGGREVELDPPWDRAGLQSWAVINVIAMWAPMWATEAPFRADRLVHAAHWAALDEIKGEHAQKRGGGAEVLDIDSPAVEANILDWDGAEPERKASQDTLEERERVKRILATVRESLGPQAATYFLAQANGASQAEAAAAAGVSERTGRRYQEAVRKLALRKKR
jgi:hypothetical protein